MDREDTGGRRIDAAEANRQAQQFDDGGGDGKARQHDVDDTVTQAIDTGGADPSSQAARANDMGAVFPSDISGRTTVGGSPEEQAMLREEENS